MVSTIVHAQTIQVLNKVTFEPIEDVLVYNYKHQLYETTDADGKVDLTDLAPSDTIFFQHHAYVQEWKTLEQLIAESNQVYLTHKIVLIDEVVVSAGKQEESVADISNQIEVVTKEDIQFRNPQTSADMLAQSGQVFVQKSQMGGGSPVLRGFEANKVLLVVDGIRMNNAIYRSGHLQNSISLEPSSLEKSEVVFGPGAVIYGSDAIGGVVQFITKSPQLSLQKGVSRIKGEAYARIASANFEKTGHANLNLGFEKWGSFTSFTYSDFDDLKMGGGRTHGFKLWGLSNYYVDRIDGRDTVIENENPNKQVYSAYRQWNLLQKIAIQPNENFKIGLNFQASSTSDIPRYEELNDFIEEDGIVRPEKFSEWYYGPQKRLLAAINFQISNKKIFDRGNIIASFQDLEESRVQRKWQSTKKRFNIESVKVAALNADFSKKLSEKNKLQYGFEFNYNRVESNVYAENINSNEITLDSDPTRYPDGGSNTQSYAFYLHDKWKPSEKIVIQAGIRYSHFILQSKFEDTTFIKLPEPDFSLSKGSLSGSVGAVFKPVPGFEVKVGLSSGFRAPNVDDYGKVREKGGQVLVPNVDLKSEFAYNAELTLVKNFDNIARLSATAYYTHLADAIVRTHTTINGRDSILYDGDSAYIVTNANILSARVFGISIGFYTDIGKFVSLTANFNYTRGKEKDTGNPMAHIPPLFGRVGMLTKVKRFQTELWVDFNGQKTAALYSQYSEDRQDEAINLGTPGWFTLNLRTTAQVNKYFSIQFALENILNQHYKPFSSGISAPGRNASLTLRAKF